MMNVPLQLLLAQSVAAASPAASPKVIGINFQGGDWSNIIGALISIVAVVCVFAYMAYKVFQDRKVELALIEKGEADLVIKLRGQKKKRNPWFFIGIGLAAILSSAVLQFSHNADVAIWFLVVGLFFVLGGLFVHFGRRFQNEENGQGSQNASSVRG